MVIWLVIALVLMTVFNQFSTRQTAQAPMEYSQFIDEVKLGRIAKVTIEGRTLKGIKADGRRFTTYSPADPWMVSDLLKAGVVVEAKPDEEPSDPDDTEDPVTWLRLAGKLASEGRHEEAEACRKTAMDLMQQNR